MCTDDNPAPVAEQSPPDAQTFATTAHLLAAIDSGMHLCSSDFSSWGIDESVDTAKMAVLGVTDDGQRRVRVPADTLIDLRGGDCVCMDRTRSTLDQQGWEI
jgi:hypothetical protein